MVYLDNAATTKIDPEVLDAMMPYLTGKYGNPGSTHKLGQEAKRAVDKAREYVAKFIGADSPEQIIFTSSGTEANNLVFEGVRHHDRPFRDTVAISAIEHDSIQNQLYIQPWRIKTISVDNNGCVGFSDISKISNMKEKPKMLSVMAMNNEIGSINPIQPIGAFCKENDILFHTDCVQAAGCMRIDVNRLSVDFSSISSHKIHGPKGVGALYVRDRSRLSPYIRAHVGGEHQEFGLRGGTENVAGIVGFGEACRLITGIETRIGANETILKKKMWTSLRYHMSKYGLVNILHDNARSSETFGKILNFRIDGIDAETMLLMLSERDVCVSAGSACRSHEQEPSRVLKAIGLTDDQARESIRVSVSRMNTEEEVEEAAKIIAETAFRLKEYSGGI